MLLVVQGLEREPVKSKVGADLKALNVEVNQGLDLD